MPSTITAFYSFSTGTTARSAEVNNNFNLMRGDFIPIDSTTTGATDLHSTLGNSEHRWQSVHYGASFQNVSTKSTDYTILDDDGIGTILVDDTSSNRTITLPTAADNEDRILMIKNTSSDGGTVTIDGEGAETIDGEVTQAINTQYDSLTVQSNGSTWNILNSASDAASSSGINYIENYKEPSSALTGWTQSDSTNFALTANTTTPLRDSSDFKIVKAASDQSGDYVAYDFDLEKADLAQKMLIAIDVDTSDSNYEDDDIAIKLYDKDNSVYIEAATVELKGGKGTFYSTPQTDASSTNYELRLIVNNTDTNGYTIYFTNVRVGPQIISYGVPATDWEAFTPTATWTTNTTSTGFHSKIGDTLKVNGNLSFTGAPDSGSIIVDLPSGLSIDTTKMSATARKNLGLLSLRDSSSGETYQGVVEYADTNSVVLSFFHDASLGSGERANNILNNDPITISSGDFITYSYEVPIQGWSSNAAMSSDLGNRDVKVKAYGNDGEAIANSTEDIPFKTVSDGANWWTNAGNTGNNTADAFTADSKMEVMVTGSVNHNINTGVAIYSYIDGVLDKVLGYTEGISDTSFAGIVSLKKGEVLTLRSSVDLILTNSSASHIINIQKFASPQTIFESESAFVEAAGNAGTGPLTANTTNIDFTEITDSHGAWNGTQFTAPSAGRYSFDGMIYTAASGTHNYFGYIDTVQQRSLNTTSVDTAAKKFHWDVILEKGEVASIRTDGTPTLSNSTVYHWIAINKIK